MAPDGDSQLDRFPLSYAQQQLWFIDQLRSGATEYLVHATYRLRGPLETGVLSAAFTEIVARHEILRTRYDSVDGEPVQVIDEPTPVALSAVDLAGAGEAAVREFVDRTLTTPIDLRADPPWRPTLIRLGPDEHVLLIVLHHIASDGTSWQVLTGELRTLYTAFLAGEPSPLPPLEVQYADYAQWQLEWFAAADELVDRQLGYWHERLAGLPPLELPTDRARPATWDARGDRVEFTLPAATHRALTELAVRHNASPFMLYLAALHLLLSRYSGQHDTAVGVSVSGRDQAELDPLIGIFLNTVLMRVDTSADPAFTALLGQVRETVLAAFDHQDVPFERVVAALAPERDLSRNPVFQVGFALHTERGADFTLPGLDVEPYSANWLTSAFDLSLHLTERSDGTLAGQLIYPTALFDVDRMERMADNLVTLLAGIEADPDRPVSRLPLVAEPERRTLLDRHAGRASATAADPRAERGLPELFLAQARATPDALAVIAGAERYSYAELAERVLALAGHLGAHGVGPETPVGVLLERGIDLVTALLAVLTAGGCYVPLPPEHPDERLRYLTENSGIGLALTSEALRGRLPGTVEALPLDTLRTETAAPCTPVAPDPDGAAYLMYTSGSTGRPKGVLVTHAGIRNRVLWSVDHYGLTAGDRVLQKTTIGFDASVWEFLSPLVSGAAVVMAPEGAHRDPAVMIGAVAEHDVTVLQLVPSVLRLVVAEPRLAECRALRAVCSAGEPLPAELCERLLSALGPDRDVAVVNTYGPTECSIDSTAADYRPGDPAGIVPIGGPLPGVRVHVVDAHDQPVPIGVPGELCVSGVGLARGYLGRGGLTASRFTPHPYPSRPGERWYRTGDLARWSAEGVLEFVGRVDDQVKVHGVRVEPGEIEAVLAEHPAVARAVVGVRRGPAGDLDLIAWTVSATGEPVATAELREYLAGRLPAPMIPAAWVAVDALPLTPNGKLDRAALPEPTAGSPEPADDHVPPRPGTEAAVAEIMGTLLKVERVGALDDFFALGGHSLLGIRLVMKLRRTFEVGLTVGQLFDARTPRALAALVDVDRAESAGEPADGLAIRPVPRDRELPLSFSQQRLWFLDQLEPGSVEYLIPLAMTLTGPLDVAALRRAVDALAARHEGLRTRYAGREGDPVQLVDPPGPVDFRLVDVSGEPDPERSGSGVLDEVSSTPFDLERSWPWRITVVRTGPDRHLLAITLHHIVFDAWSMGIFLRDLGLAYRAFAAGEDNPLRPLAVQYADFAVWQRDRQAAGDLTPQLDYWRERLAGLVPVELTAGRPRPARRDPYGDTLVLEVPDQLGRAALELGNRHGATLFMVLLGAFQVLLSRYTGSTDIGVGTPVAGRTRQETEDLLGFFVNSLVLRTDLAAAPSFVDFLAQVRGVVLDAFAHQDVPFEHLVDALRPDRDLSRNPLFQVMFELQHLDAFPTELGQAAVSPIRSGAMVAKFDLTVSVQQRPDGRLRCEFEYSTALFDRSTVERLAGHYLRLLESVTADPAARLPELDLLTEPERRALLTEWPDPDSGRTGELDPAGEHHLTVPELFARRAARTPDRIAVVAGGVELSYAELNARANRLAHHLRDLGAGPEVVIGSCLERGPEAVVALLAVLKAGAVYVPFDPAHPAERLNFMLADAGVRAVLTTEEFAGRLDGAHPVVLVDADPPGDAGDPRPWAGPDNLAYVIYTSGSTGRPKGVLIEHRSYAHHCRVIADAYDIGPDDRVVLLSALTFDVAMDQIAATLLAGATVVVSDPVFWTPAELPDRLAEHGVTIMEITPAYYREILASGRVPALSGLKLMNVGSDVVTVADARRWAETGLPARFLCNYGPTEATVTCVLHPVPDDLGAARDEAAMPIGRPVPGTRGYVLDADLRPVPAGVPGELCLGGIRLARGYHRRPGLTAEKFVPDPFGSGQRLYRTGDLVRYRPDGAIEFLGRIDQQVKIRGFRIELGEIEAALAQHPAVAAVAVAAVPAGPGDRRLVAYPVFEPGQRPEVAELREHLRPLVPEYMIPSVWTPLAELPLTTSKKVNRNALPAPVFGAADEREHVAPRDEIEQAVADIWSDVLDLARVGALDDFFALGGHSLLATRVLARLRAAFAVDLPLRTLFEATTVAGLAEAVALAVEADIAALSDTEVDELLSQEGVR